MQKIGTFRNVLKKVTFSGKLDSILSIWAKYSLLGEQDTPAKDLGICLFARPLNDSRA